MQAGPRHRPFNPVSLRLWDEIVVSDPDLLD